MEFSFPCPFRLSKVNFCWLSLDLRQSAHRSHGSWAHFGKLNCCQEPLNRFSLFVGCCLGDSAEEKQFTKATSEKRPTMARKRLNNIASTKITIGNIAASSHRKVQIADSLASLAENRQKIESDRSLIFFGGAMLRSQRFLCFQDRCAFGPPSSLRRENGTARPWCWLVLQSTSLRSSVARRCMHLMSVSTRWDHHTSETPRRSQICLCINIASPTAESAKLVDKNIYGHLGFSDVLLN